MLGHPYRTASPPRDTRPAAPSEGAPDSDIAPVAGITLIASVAHLVWAGSASRVDGDLLRALAAAIVCLLLLRPFVGYWLGRVLRRRGP